MTYFYTIDIKFTHLTAVNKQWYTIIPSCAIKIQTTKKRGVRWMYRSAARFDMLHSYRLTLCTEWVQIKPSFNHSLIPHCNAGALSGPQAENLYSMESIESIGLFRTSMDDTAVPGTFFFCPLSFLFVSFYFFLPLASQPFPRSHVLCADEKNRAPSQIKCDPLTHQFTAALSHQSPLHWSHCHWAPQHRKNVISPH